VDHPKTTLGVDPHIKINPRKEEGVEVGVGVNPGTVNSLFCPTKFKAKTNGCVGEGAQVGQDHGHALEIGKSLAADGTGVSEAGVVQVPAQKNKNQEERSPGPREALRKNTRRKDTN